MAEEKKKSLFQKAIDALTDRDETEVEDQANGEVAARAQMAADQAAVEQAAVEKAATDQAATHKASAERGPAVEPVAEKEVARGTAEAPKKGVVTVRSLRIRADHNTSSEVVAGLLEGDEVTILSTWSDGKETWARLDKGWAAMIYHGETYIKLV